MIFIKLSVGIVLNVVAVVLSVVSLVFTQINRRKNEELTLQISRQTLEAKFYESIFEEMLVLKIPESRNKICIVDNKIAHHLDLFDIMGELKKKSIYFRYRNKDFYNSLKESCTLLEDYLAKVNDNIDSGVEAYDSLGRIDDYIQEIYKIIFENYLPHQ